jgi:hypothetical protein
MFCSGRVTIKPGVTPEQAYEDHTGQPMPDSYAVFFPHTDYDG